MKCARCDADNDPGARFCEDCGARLDAPCPSCGTAVTPGKKFCRSCGAAITTEPVGRFASPESYTPKHLADRILTSRPALEGERKQVTVLFADLKGSMELLADRDPEDARNILDPVLTLMIDAVHRYEGTVNQVMGDGIMALFGAPLAHEDHAVRACYAALRMQESVKRCAVETRRSVGVPLAIRVGLNSGEVVVRSIGSDLHMDYTAVGQTTHLAARMEQAALPGSVLLTPDTLRLAEGFVEVTPLGAMPVKGLADPVEAYELIGAGPARTRFQAAAARGLTRFVGRDAEVQQLRHALERAASGHGQIVAIVGEAGVGKSRLFYEFTRSHRVHGCLILESGSVSYGTATVYLPVSDLLKGYFKIQDRDQQREIRDKVIGRVLGLDRSLEPLLPPILALLDVAVDDPGWEALDPPQRRQRTLAAIKQLLLRESQVQPLLLVVEDLHWIDGDTQALLDALAESLGSFRLLLLVNYRPEYEHRWGKKTYYTQLRLESLPPETTGGLLHALLGDAPELEPLKQMLRRRGNPFFLEETVRTLVETKVLDGERGAYRLVRSVQSLQIPATVQAILAARIDRLPAEAKQLLQAASVIGKDVPYAILAAIAELHEQAVRAALGHLQEAEFLYETSLFPDLEYTFKHALTQEVAYRTLPLEIRRGYHERIARALEASFAGRLDEKSEVLARHYEQSGNDEKALEYLLRAVQRATTRFASTEASRYYTAVVACLDRLPKTEERERQRIDLRLSEVELVWMQGRYDEGYHILEETQTLAERLHDSERLAQIHFRFGWYLYDQLELDRAFQHQQDCFELCQRLGRVATMRRVYWGLGNSCRAISADVAVRRAKAIEFHEEGLRLGEAVASPQFFDVHNGHFLWLIHLFQLGESATALRYLERAEALARKLPESLHLALMTGSRGLSNLLTQKTQGDLDLLRGSLRAAEEAAHHIYTTISHYLLGQGHFLLGDFAAAIGEFEATLAIAAQTGNLFLPGTLLWTAETETRLGRHDAALEHVVRYEGLIERTGPLEGLAWFPSRGVAHRIRGLVLAAREDFTAASAEFARSVELLAAHGYKPDLARTHVALGDLERRHGRSREARHAFETAAMSFREMGFAFELHQTARLLNEGSVIG
jgi:class 3 adenylate cyclase/tetratricopeptide (TPR) repeat protein